MGSSKIIRPTLLLDLEKCKKNIHRMAQKVRSQNLRFRPHFKTHQSAEIAELFRDEGIEACTVSSVKMAEYFSNYNWSDILIAFPANVLEAEKINDLAQRVKLQLLVYNKETLTIFAEKLDVPIGIKIELDLGSKRSGLTLNQHEEIDQLLKTIDEIPRFQFTGFYSHPGHTYACRGKDQVIKNYEGIIKQLEMLKASYGHTLGFSITIGDTPGCTIVEEFGPVEEISPGNFVFYDLMQLNIGSCDYTDIAVVMACPVVGINPDRAELLIHGGAVHFSKEVLQDPDGTLYYGKIALSTESGWDGIIPDAYLKSISQEHGLIHVSEDLLQETQIGDIVYIYPVHSCLTADLMKSYLTTDELLMQGESAFMP